MVQAHRRFDELSNDTAHYLLRHSWFVRHLPRPEETWQQADLDIEISPARLCDCRRRGVIQLVERDPANNIATWQTAEKTWDWLLDHELVREDGSIVETCGDGPLPCGGGFVNVGGPKPLECKRCETRYATAALEG